LNLFCFQNLSCCNIPSINFSEFISFCFKAA
jgi:hypothetical protein